MTRNKLYFFTIVLTLIIALAVHASEVNPSMLVTDLGCGVPSWRASTEFDFGKGDLSWHYFFSNEKGMIISAKDNQREGDNVGIYNKYYESYAQGNTLYTYSGEVHVYKGKILAHNGPHEVITRVSNTINVYYAGNLCYTLDADWALLPLG